MDDRTEGVDLAGDLPSPFIVGSSRMAQAAAMAGWTLGVLSSFFQPLELQGSIQALRLSNVDAAMLLSAEILAMVLTLFVFGIRQPTFPFRRAGMIALLLVIGGNIASALSPDYPFLLIARIVTGVGAGVALGVANSFACRFADPTKTSAMMNAASMATASILYFIAPVVLTKDFGETIYLLLATASAMLALPLLLGLPDLPMNMPVVESSDDAIAPSGRIGYIIATSFLLCMANAALTSFAAQLGPRAGLSGDGVALTLGLGTLCAIAGPVALSIVGVRMGRARPVVGALLCDLLACIAMGLSRNPAIFVMGVILMNIAAYILIPFFFGYAAEADRSGRAVAILGSFGLGTFAVAPLCAGYLTDHFGLVAIGWFSILSIVVALLTFRQFLAGTRRAGSAPVTIEPRLHHAP